MMKAEQCMTRTHHLKLGNLEEEHYRSTQQSESQSRDDIDRLSRVYKRLNQTKFEMVGQDMLALWIHTLVIKAQGIVSSMQASFLSDTRKLSDL